MRPHTTVYQLACYIHHTARASPERTHVASNGEVGVTMILAIYFALGAGQHTIDRQHGASLYQSCLATIRLVDSSPKAIPSTQDGLAGQYCLGYLDGYIAFLLNTRPANVCVENTKRLTIVRQYVAYMRSHPAAMDAPKDWGLLQTLLDSYPCQSAPEAH